MSKFVAKRIYEAASTDDGYRVFVDRLWARGIRREKAVLDEWLQEIAPSDALRKWFHHENGTFEEFSSRYKEELKSKTDLLHHLQELAEKQQVCLLYGAKDEKHNQAIVLLQVLEKGLDAV